MAKPTVFVSGHRALDKAFKNFAENDNKGARKALREAAKESIEKVVLVDYRSRVPVRKGVMRDATKFKAPKRSAKRIGRSLVIDRKKLFKLYRKRYGREPGKRKGDTEPFFYPAVVELGGHGKKKNASLRTALFSNEKRVRKEFIKALKRAIQAAGIRVGLLNRF